jgi:hypothetical protein
VYDCCYGWCNLLQDTFQYRALDNPSSIPGRVSNEATVTVTIVGPLTANPDQDTVPAGAGTVISVLLNDFGGTPPLTVTAVTQPNQGSASVTGGNAIVFVAPGNSAGQVGAPLESILYCAVAECECMQAAVNLARELAGGLNFLVLLVRSWARSQLKQIRMSSAQLALSDYFDQPTLL